MLAMVLEKQGETLVHKDLSLPDVAEGQVRIKVSACGVCRTDIHILDGDLLSPKLPLVPGHEIIGIVNACGDGVDELSVGDKVGVPWLGWTDGTCEYCRSGRENLCDHARFTGYTIDGGYAEYAVADARYCFPVDSYMDDAHMAPLMCAGLIGYRSLRMTGDARSIGFYGFGASAHIICQVAVYQGRKVYAFTKPGDTDGQQFAMELGCVWADGSDKVPPVELDAAIVFAPVGAIVPAALRAVRKGGVVVCAGIHMSDIPSFPYSILWGERTVMSVANLTRRDGEELLAVAPKAGVKTTVTTYPLADGNRAVEDFRSGRMMGAAVLMVQDFTR